MKIPMPINGLHQGLALEEQPPTTTPHSFNVRPTDVSDERSRIGQRPGLIKAYTTPHILSQHNGSNNIS